MSTSARSPSSGTPSSGWQPVFAYSLPPSSRLSSHAKPRPERGAVLRQREPRSQEPAQCYPRVHRAGASGRAAQSRATREPGAGRPPRARALGVDRDPSWTPPVWKLASWFSCANRWSSRGCSRKRPRRGVNLGGESPFEVRCRVTGTCPRSRSTGSACRGLWRHSSGTRCEPRVWADRTLGNRLGDARSRSRCCFRAGTLGTHWMTSWAAARARFRSSNVGWLWA